MTQLNYPSPKEKGEYENKCRQYLPESGNLNCIGMHAALVDAVNFILALILYYKTKLFQVLKLYLTYISIKLDLLDLTTTKFERSTVVIMLNTENIH